MLMLLYLLLYPCLTVFTLSLSHIDVSFISAQSQLWVRPFMDDKFARNPNIQGEKMIIMKNMIKEQFTVYT